MDLKEFSEIFKRENEFDRFNGLSFNIIKPGHIEYEMTIEKQHISFKNIAHGGVTSSMMDAVLGFAALTQAVTEGQLVSTVEFKLNFIRPIHHGETLIGIGIVEHNGKSLIISNANIYVKGTDQLVAKGLGTFNKYPMSKKGLGDKSEN
jgi:uncharacterized protein (TIGR00369 family)